MAEGLSRSVQGGSDFDTDTYCTPCDDGGMKKEAANFCPSCDQYMCLSCSNCHNKLPATKHHMMTKLIPCTVRAKRTNIATKCSIHPDRFIDMYCGRHKMVYCALCVVKDHRSCKGVIEVNDSTKPLMKENDLQTLMEKVDALQTTINTTKARKEENMKIVEDEEKTFVANLNDICTNLEQIIDSRKMSALKSLKTQRDNILAQLGNDVTQMDDMKKKLVDFKAQTSSQMSMTDGQNLIHQVLGLRAVSDTNSLLAKLNSGNKNKMIELDGNKHLQECSALLQVAECIDLVPLKLLNL